MTESPKIVLYTVEGSLPPPPGRGWRENKSFEVLTTDVVTAIALVLAELPELTVHAVNRRSRPLLTILFDPRITVDAPA